MVVEKPCLGRGRGDKGPSLAHAGRNSNWSGDTGRAMLRSLTGKKPGKKTGTPFHASGVWQVQNSIYAQRAPHKEKSGPKDYTG